MSSRLEQLQDFLSNSPGDSFILFAIAKEHEKLGNIDSALAHYLQIETNDPDYVGLYYHLGKLYEIQNDFSTAILTYKKGMAVAKKINDQHALSELAGAKLNLEDDE